MTILIVEDDEDKRAEIIGYLGSLGVVPGDIVLAKDMAEFSGKFDAQVAICVIDLRLPAYEGAEQDRNGLGILQAIDRSGNSGVKLLAISAYPEEFGDVRTQFESRGCILVDYGQREVWQSVLKQMILQVENVERMDFVIFCALRSERAPYTAMQGLAGKAKSKGGLTRLDITISGKNGTVVELPRMGLVDAAVLAGQCIERFKPGVVAMSGICAGFAGRAELGQLLVAELAYEYQSGKWTADGFSQEPYQVPVSENVRVLLRGLLEDQHLFARLEAGWETDRPAKVTKPSLATFTSGSAVIADQALMKQVATYHRRVTGLDMEMYGLMRAGHIAACRPDLICAKAVVDLAGGNKNDLLHPYGSQISARFIVEAISRYFDLPQKR